MILLFILTLELRGVKAGYTSIKPLGEQPSKNAYFSILFYNYYSCPGQSFDTSELFDQLQIKLVSPTIETKQNCAVCSAAYGHCYCFVHLIEK